jgi:hypothetical protein
MFGEDVSFFCVVSAQVPCSALSAGEDLVICLIFLFTFPRE